MSRTGTSPFLHIKTFVCVDTVKYQIHINQRYLSRPVMDSSLVFGNALQIPPSVSTIILSGRTQSFVGLHS
jgi:hypothetical protein